MKLYLASISPRRKEILKKLGIKFQVIKPRLAKEINWTNGQVTKYPQLLAKMKVESVKHKVKKGIIIGMDTIVVLNKKILGKPKNQSQAKRMLIQLSGKTHKVITGIYLLRLPEGKSVQGLEKTSVKFRNLTQGEIDRYIKTKEPYDKAGSYAIQGSAGLFIESINGCYTNVIGFPVARFLWLYKKLLTLPLGNL